MKSIVKCVVLKFIILVAALLSPVIGRAQNTGQVECPRNDGYVYLYSSITTLDVRGTLQCGEQVDITSRYETYFAVRTSKGDTGFVPLNFIVVLKDKPGPKVAKPSVGPSRERIAYDNGSAPAKTAAKAKDPAAGFTLANGTPIRIKLNKTISSATSHVGEPVNLEVIDEIAVDGVPVIAKGAQAIAVVTEAEPKKRMGHGGKLGFSITAVVLNDNEKAPVRSYQETGGSTSTTLTLASGKDVVFTEGTEFTAIVDGDFRLKPEAFQPGKDGGNAAPATAAQKPPRTSRQ